MKENSIEEDIKICEEKIKFLNKKYADEHGEDYYPAITVSTKFNARTLLAFENLLTRYKQLEEENNNMAEEYLVNNPGMAKYLNDNYIFKSKVKEKIEEINKAYEDSKDENGESQYYYPDYTIRVLEELLEKRK